MNEFDGYPLTDECRKVLLATQQYATAHDGAIAGKDLVLGVLRHSFGCGHRVQVLLSCFECEHWLEVSAARFANAHIAAESAAPIALHPDVRPVLRPATRQADRLGDKYLSPLHLLLSIFADKESDVSQELHSKGLDTEVAWRLTAGEADFTYLLRWPFQNENVPRLALSDFNTSSDAREHLRSSLICSRKSTETKLRFGAEVQAVLATAPKDIQVFRDRYVRLLTRQAEHLASLCTRAGQ